jgi:carbon storage regulator
VLVLSRGPGQSVVIGGNVVVTVVEVKGDLVRLGIDAPREVPVHREEVFHAVRQANLAAAGASEDALTAFGRQLKEARRPR